METNKFDNQPEQKEEPLFVLLDTETSGTEEKDRVLQLAYLQGKISMLSSLDIDGWASELSSLPEGVEIAIEAMEVHNITPERIEGKAKTVDTSAYQKWLTMNGENNYFIAHNANFDKDMLDKEGVSVKMKIVDTLRCSRHLFDADEFPRHRLGYLYYKLGLYNKLDALVEKSGANLSGLGAHHALYDVFMLYLLLDVMLKKVDGNIDKLVELTQTPVLIKKFTFGKYKDQIIAEVAEENLGYLRWMVNNIENMDEDLKYTLDKYLV